MTELPNARARSARWGSMDRGRGQGATPQSYLQRQYRVETDVAKPKEPSTSPLSVPSSSRARLPDGARTCPLESSLSGRPGVHRPAKKASLSAEAECAVRPTPQAWANPDASPTQAVKTLPIRLVVSNGASRARGFRAASVSGAEPEDDDVGADGEARAADPCDGDRSSLPSQVGLRLKLRLFRDCL